MQNTVFRIVEQQLDELNILETTQNMSISGIAFAGSVITSDVCLW